MKKYFKWLSKNTHPLTNKLVIFIGATGSIGKEALEYLLMLETKVIIGARNVEKANNLKQQLLLKYPQATIFVEHIDVSSLDSIDTFQKVLTSKYPKADFFINNSGVYHLPKNFSKDGYEIHFATNALGNYYLAKRIIENLKENSKMVFVSSLSANFYKINFQDFESVNCKNKMKVYAQSKRIMLSNTISLKEELKNIDINVIHPGICATELFNKSHGKFFMKIIFPIMKLIFHSPKKASLNILKGLFIKTEINEWICPRFIGVWGYPKIKKIAKRIYKKENINRSFELTNNLIKQHINKKW